MFRDSSFTMGSTITLPVNGQTTAKIDFQDTQPNTLYASPPESHDEADALTCALDELACGLIIIDAQARVLHANAAGRAIVARGDVVKIDCDTVHTSHHGDAQQFADALVKATQGKRSMIALGSMARTTVAVVPLRQALTNGHTPRFVLMFSRVGVCEALMLSFFARAHSLTGAEEKILGLLCSGLTAPEMAGQLHVGEATVRTHVRSICVKTQSNGIRDVVKRLAVLPPLMTAVAGV